MGLEHAVIIRDKTRLEQLTERFNTKAQARFYIERSGADFDLYEEEHRVFYTGLRKLQDGLKKELKYKVVDRSFLPTYLFNEQELVIVVGQDGLVANTAKYVNDQPIIAVNPDPASYTGVLLPYSPATFKNALNSVLANTHKVKTVTMAEAVMSDGQRLLAFNDFFIGASSHVSARYRLSFQGESEVQSSSGIIVSTGAGSTGWLSSVFNMTHNVNQYFRPGKKHRQPTMDWNTNHLLFVVREPYASVNTQVSLGFGRINKNDHLHIESHMAGNGIIFSDGIEADHLEFNTGTSVKISMAPEKAHIVV